MFSKPKSNPSPVTSEPRIEDEGRIMKPQNDAFAVLPPNLVVVGNVISEGSMHIDGTVEGDIQAVALTIGATGVIKGRVFGKEVKVSGRVEGPVTAAELILEETAVIKGDVNYQSVSVSRGAKLEGHFSHKESGVDITALSPRGKTAAPAGRAETAPAPKAPDAPKTDDTNS